MQELVKVKQKQAELVKQLLGTAIDRGQSYLGKLEKLNIEDNKRTTQRSKQTPPAHPDRIHRHHYSDSRKREVMYAKVTSAHNVNNNANTPSGGNESHDRQTTVAAPKTPVYRIRSLPQSKGDDDTIMIAGPMGLPSLHHDMDQQTGATTNRESRNNAPSFSRQHAPLPPVPDDDTDAVYSLAQAIPPPQPSLVHHSPRQNAPLPPPPTVSATECGSTPSRIDEPFGSEVGHPSSSVCRSFHNAVYEEATSIQPCSSVPAGQPPEYRKRSPLPPLPQAEGPLETSKQLSDDKRVDVNSVATVNNSNSKHHALRNQPPQGKAESSNLSANQIAQRSRSPSPYASPRDSPGRSAGSAPSPPPPYSSSRRRSQSSSNIMANYRQSMIKSNDEEAPPPPPPRKTSAPVDSSPASTGKKSSESTVTGNHLNNMPRTPLHKTSVGRPNDDPGEAPPLPSRKICDNHNESGSILPPADSDEPVAPPLPSRNVIVPEKSEVQGRQPIQHSPRARTRSSESLKSLSERKEVSSVSSSNTASEGIFSRSAMQRRLKGLLHVGTPISRHRASSNDFITSSCAKSKLGKRLSDPSRTPSGKSSVPIHKTPLPPIPVQMPASTSAPQLLDEPQDVYEDPDHALKSVEEDEPQLHYEDIDMDEDRPQDHYEDIDMDSDRAREHYEDIDMDGDRAREHYEDIDMDSDRPHDYYEDIDHDNEDRPQEVYEDINNEAAQRVTFKVSGPQDYTPPISRRSMAVDEPEDYTPPISRRSRVYSEEDEPQDYTVPIRMSRVYYEEDDEEPQDYTPPIRRSALIEVQDGPSTPSPPLPPRSSSCQRGNQRRRGAVRNPSSQLPSKPVSKTGQPPPTNTEHHQMSTQGHEAVAPPTNLHTNSTSRGHPVDRAVSPAHAKPPAPPRSHIPPGSQAPTPPAHPRSNAVPHAGSRDRSSAPPRSPRSPLPSPTRSRPPLADKPQIHSNATPTKVPLCTFLN